MPTDTPDGAGRDPHGDRQGGPGIEAQAGVLRPADKDLLAAAIREGMAPDPPSWRSLVKSIAFVVIVGAALMGGYQGLQRWRPAVALKFDADQTAPSQQITFGDLHDQVLWRVTSGNVTSLQVTGPESDTVEIDLPLPVSECSQVATDLGPSARCVATAGGAPSVQFASPVSIGWTSPTPVELLPPAGARFLRSTVLGVTVNTPQAMPAAAVAAPAAAPPDPTTLVTPTSVTPTSVTPTSGTSPPVTTPEVTTPSSVGTGSAVTFAAGKGPDGQRWCFDSPLSANRLQLQRGANQYRHAFTGSEPDVVCGAGLHLVVGSVGSEGLPPAVTLQGVASLRLEALTTQADAQLAVGQLHLSASGSTVLGAPSELVVRARPSLLLDATVLEQAGRSKLSLTSPGATSVMTDNGNLVTSVWARYQDFTLPILLTIAGGLIPILLATMQGVMSAHRVRHRRPEAG